MNRRKAGELPESTKPGEEGVGEIGPHARVKRVHYVNTSFLTDDRIADALMNYSSALAIVNTADVVRIPGVDDSGQLHAYELVVGPSSQLMSVGAEGLPADLLPQDLPVDEVVADLVERSERRLPSTVEIDRAIWGGPVANDTGD
jgi:hypothetical protein